jgi:hypothetical protein
METGLQPLKCKTAALEYAPPGRTPHRWWKHSGVLETVGSYGNPECSDDRHGRTDGCALRRHRNAPVRICDPLIDEPSVALEATRNQPGRTFRSASAGEAHTDFAPPLTPLSFANPIRNR